MMKGLNRLLLGITALLWIGCSDETTVFEAVQQDDPFLVESVASAGGSVTYDFAGVLKFREPLQAFGMEEAPAGDYPLTLVASITPPTRQDGSLFTASHVDVHGGFAYVGYNTAGDVYEGAIDAVDISDPNNPVVTSRLIYRNADVNAVHYEGGFLFAAGSVDAEISDSAVSNSFVARIPALGGTLETEGILYGFQQGYTATDVTVHNSRVLVSSGQAGSVVSYNSSDLSPGAEIFLFDARSLAASGSRVVVLDAGSGVRVLGSDLNENLLIPIASDLGEGSKKTLDLWNDWVIVSEGANGAGIYETSSGNPVAHLPIPLAPEGVDTEYLVTNAVSVNENAIFMANGGAGLSLAEREGSGAATQGVIELEGSVNYVVSKDDFAFAASGSNGLHIIKLNRPADSLETRYLDLPQYEGKSRMSVGKTESLAFRGQKRLQSLQVQGSLTLGGSWTVYEEVRISEGGALQLIGSMAVGRNDRRQDVVLEPGATLKVRGQMTLYGDLILGEGATLEFQGPNAVMDIFGQVRYLGDATVQGLFRDVRGKFE